jgi:hypothetical protein
MNITTTGCTMTQYHRNRIQEEIDRQNAWLEEQDDPSWAAPLMILVGFIVIVALWYFG